MSTQIEKAREAVWKQMQKLHDAGLRRDYTLKIRRAEPAADPLSMDPAAAAEPAAQEILEIPAPAVKAYSGFAMLAIQQAAGGNVEVGDHRVKFPRAKVVEDFLGSVRDSNTPQPAGPYPEMTKFIFEVGGVDCRPVRWLPGTIFLEVYVRTIPR